MRPAALLIAALILLPADEVGASVVCQYKYQCNVTAAGTVCWHQEESAPGNATPALETYEYCYTGFRSTSTSKGDPDPCDGDTPTFLRTGKEFMSTIKASDCLARNEISARVIEPPWGPWSPATCRAPSTRTRTCTEPSGALPSSRTTYCHQGTTDGPHPCPP